MPKMARLSGDQLHIGSNRGRRILISTDLNQRPKFPADCNQGPLEAWSTYQTAIRAHLLEGLSKCSSYLINAPSASSVRDMELQRTDMTNRMCSTGLQVWGRAFSSDLEESN